MEKVYKTMQRAGAGSIAMGIIVMVVGLTVGILSIVCGSVLLKNKNDLVF